MKNITASILVTLLILLLVVNFVPMSSLNIRGEQPMLGTVGTTDVATTDLLTAWPTLYNANLALLEAGKVDVASTTWPQLTTATGLVSVGALTSGSLAAGFTDVPVAQGGTGQSAWTQYLMLYADTTTSLAQIPIGTSGQFLKSNGAGSAPSFQTSSVDEAASYNFTGTSFRVKNLHASSTAANPLILNKVSYDFPTTGGTATQALTDDGTGSLTWATTTDMLWGTTTTAVYSGASATLFSVTIPGGLLADGEVIHGKLLGSWVSASVTTKSITLVYGGDTCGTQNAGTQDTSTKTFDGSFEFYIQGAGGTSAQRCWVSFQGAPNEFETAGGANYASITQFGDGAVDSTANRTLTLSIDQNSGATEKVTIYQGYIEHLE